MTISTQTHNIVPTKDYILLDSFRTAIITLCVVLKTPKTDHIRTKSHAHSFVYKAKACYVSNTQFTNNASRQLDKTDLTKSVPCILALIKLSNFFTQKLYNQTDIQL